MAQFKPYRAKTITKLNNLAIVEGQFIICEENQTLYFDKDSETRIPVGSASDLSLALVKNVLSLMNGEDIIDSVEIPLMMNAVAWNNSDIEVTDENILSIDSYTREETDAKFNDVYNKTETDAKFDNVYDKNEIDNLIGDITELMSQL